MDDQTNSIVRWGFIVAVASLLMPVFAIVALILGGIAATRSRVGSGVAIMVIGLVLGATGFTVAYQTLLEDEQNAAPSIAADSGADAVGTDSPAPPAPEDQAMSDFRSALDATPVAATINTIDIEESGRLSVDLVVDEAATPSVVKDVCAAVKSVDPDVTVAINEAESSDDGYGPTWTQVASCGGLTTPGQ